MYPHIVTGAWASSAPMDAKMDLIEYYEACGVLIQTVGGEDYYTNLVNTFGVIKNLSAARKEYHQKIVQGWLSL